jgi:outer membrane protein insertion porin family
MPTDGHFAELAFEQGFGEFMYPRFELQATQHWSPYERVDGTGKHVLTVHGEANWTDSGTPLFERYFAGGYQSFRGFAYRGVGPLEQGIRVGGNTMLLGSAEYSIPVTADDSIRVVGFTDFGTVEQDLNSLSSDSFRLAVGFGFRVAIPIMGPAPLAFDFGFPVLKEPGDHERVFSFTVGWSR